MFPRREHITDEIADALDGAADMHRVTPWYDEMTEADLSFWVNWLVEHRERLVEMYVRSLLSK